MASRRPLLAPAGGLFLLLPLLLPSGRARTQCEKTHKSGGRGLRGAGRPAGPERPGQGDGGAPRARAARHWPLARPGGWAAGGRERARARDGGGLLSPPPGWTRHLRSARARRLAQRRLPARTRARLAFSGRGGTSRLAQGETPLATLKCPVLRPRRKAGARREASRQGKALSPSLLVGPAAAREGRPHSSTSRSCVNWNGMAAQAKFCPLPTNTVIQRMRYGASIVQSSVPLSTTPRGAALSDVCCLRASLVDFLRASSWAI